MVMTALGVAFASHVPFFSLHPFKSIAYGFIGTAAGLSSAYVTSPKTMQE